jgi:hypothetical protein
VRLRIARSGPVFRSGSTRRAVRMSERVRQRVGSVTDQGQSHARRLPESDSEDAVEQQLDLAQRTFAVTEPPQRSDRESAIAAGSLLILGVVTSLVSTGVLGDIVGGDNYLASIRANEARVLVSIVFQFLTTVCSAGIAIAFYPVLRRHSPTLAIGAVSFRVIEAVFLQPGGAGPALSCRPQLSVDEHRGRRRRCRWWRPESGSRRRQLRVRGVLVQYRRNALLRRALPGTTHPGLAHAVGSPRRIAGLHRCDGDAGRWTSIRHRGCCDRARPADRYTRNRARAVAYRQRLRGPRIAIDATPTSGMNGRHLTATTSVSRVSRASQCARWSGWGQ